MRQKAPVFVSKMSLTEGAYFLKSIDCRRFVSQNTVRKRRKSICEDEINISQGEPRHSCPCGRNINYLTP